MINYNWNTPLVTLFNDNFIDEDIYIGLTQFGIQYLRDLKKEEALKQSSFLKQVAAKLCEFLDVFISIEFKKLSLDEFVMSIPQDLITSTEYIFIWITSQKGSEATIKRRFPSPMQLLYYVIAEQEDILRITYDRSTLTGADYNRYKNEMICIISLLARLSSNFANCSFYGRLFSKILSDSHVSAEELTQAWTKFENLSIEDALNKKHLKIATERDSSLEALFELSRKNLSVRARNVLGRAGIYHYADFLPWIEDTKKSFLELKTCGRKSDLELNQLRDSMLDAIASSKNVPVGALVMNGAAGECEQKNAIEILKNNLLSNKCDANIYAYFTSDVGKKAYNVIVAPLKTCHDIVRYNKVEALDLLSYIQEGLALSIVSVDDYDVMPFLIHSLSKIQDFISSNKKELRRNKLSSKAKDRLIEEDFNNIVKGLRGRSRHVVLSVATDYHSFLRLKSANKNISDIKNAGHKTEEEIEEAYTTFQAHCLGILFVDDSYTSVSLLSNTFPFLTAKDVMFIDAFYKENGYMPSFFILKAFLSTSHSKNISVYADYYGLSDSKPLTLDELSKRYLLTRERVRQLIATPSKWHDKTLDSITQQEGLWSHYAFLNDSLMTCENCNFISINQKEQLNISFYSFCGLCNLLLHFNIISIDNEFFAFSKEIASYRIQYAVREVKRLDKLNKTNDLKIPIKEYFIENDEYWSTNHVYSEQSEKLAYKLLEAIIHKVLPEIVCKDGVLLFKANHRDIKDVIYGILEAYGKPMKLKDIFVKYKEIIPDDGHDTPASLRQSILLDERIEPIGKISTYKLKKWSGFAGTIPELLLTLLKTHVDPVKVDTLVEECLKFRQDSTARSIGSNISAKVSNGMFTMYYPDLVGIANREYDKKFMQLPTSFKEFINAFKDFVLSNKRYPEMRNLGYESMLIRWYNDARQLICLTDDQIEEFSNTIKWLDKFHYPRNSNERNFLRQCELYKNFVSDTGRMVAQDDDASLNSWFSRANQNFAKWNDNRQVYFKELIKFISLKLSENLGN